MKEIIAIILMFMFFPKRTIRKKSEEFRQTRKERYKRKEYKFKKKNRKFNHLDLFRGNAMVKLLDNVFKVRS